MRVLACDREGCGSTLCDRHNYYYGYICDECFEELVNSGPETDIADFMRSVKKRTRDKEAEARARLELFFPLRKEYN